jgi:hypothetical protein
MKLDEGVKVKPTSRMYKKVNTLLDVLWCKYEVSVCIYCYHILYFGLEKSKEKP